MNMSARYKSGDYCSSYEFDYHTDFSQFLEEARNNATRKQQLDPGKRNRKSFKTSLFSWLKSHKKTKQPNSGASIVSGATVDCGSSRNRWGACVRLAGFMNSTRRAEEYEVPVPYMCLDELNNSQKIKSYGPVYLVT